MADSPATPNGAIEAGEGDFIERLLAGPDDAVLTHHDLALLRAHLNQPVSLAQRRREARAEGRSETAQRRNKLKLIYNFNRYLRAESPAAIESEPAKQPALDAAKAREQVENAAHRGDEADRRQAKAGGGKTTTKQGRVCVLSREFCHWDDTNRIGRTNDRGIK